MKLFSVNYTTPVGIEIFSKAQEAANMEILESWCYTRGVGQRRSLAESRPFPGNSRWCSAWLNSREVSGIDPKRGAVCSREDSRRYDVLSYTSGAAGGSGVIEILRLYQVSSMSCLYQVKSTFCLYQVKSMFCLYQGVVYPYSHQCSWDGKRLGGRYTPVERLRRRLCDCRREGRRLGDDRLVSPISNTVGGWARRSKAAASGRAASITTRVSGRWASGSSGYTTPGLSLVASPASRVLLVICRLKAVQRRVWCRVAAEKVRRSQILSCSL